MRVSDLVHVKSAVFGDTECDFFRSDNANIWMSREQKP